MKTIIIDSQKHGCHNIFVDDEDFEYLNQFKWHIWKNKNNFYARRSGKINGKYVKELMHRLILNVSDSKILIDHKDHNGCNNQRNNIRACTNSENQRNKRSHKNSSSQYLGVSFSRKRLKWVAQIQSPSKRISLGRFFDEIQAAIAYDNAAKKHYGEFANLNFK